MAVLQEGVPHAENADPHLPHGVAVLVNYAEGMGDVGCLRPRRCSKATNWGLTAGIGLRHINSYQCFSLNRLSHPDMPNEKFVEKGRDKHKERRQNLNMSLTKVLHKQTSSTGLYPAADVPLN